MIGKAFDNLVTVFSPEAGLKRARARQLLDKKRSTYAAAKTDRLTGDWLPVNSSINEIIRSSSPLVNARVSQLIRDFPYFKRATDVLVNLTVGDGAVLQSRVKDEDGNVDKKTRQKIEDAWKFWMDEADAAGKQHFNEIQQLAKRQTVEFGECLLVKKHDKEKNRFLPFTLQAYEPGQLTMWGKPGGVNGYEQGVEYQKETGRALYYWFENEFRPLRVPAEQVIHYFKVLRAGQMRGISGLVTAVLVAHDLSDYMDAEMDGAKLAAKWLAFIKTDHRAEFQAGMEEDEEDRRIEELENGIIEYLGKGEEIELASASRPGDHFAPFVKLVLQMIAVTSEISYELLSGDYDGISYSNLRGIRNDLAQQMRPHQASHIRHICMPVFKEFLNQAVLKGRLDLPGYYKDPYHYLNSVWLPPGMESIDPLKEGKANVEQIKAALKSPQEICAGRGRDYEEIIEEIAEAKRLCEEKGLDWMAVSTASATSPSALETLEGANDGEE